MRVDPFLARLQEAERMVNQGKAPEAEAVCRTVLREAPGLPEATALLGFVVVAIAGGSFVFAKRDI